MASSYPSRRLRWPLLLVLLLSHALLLVGLGRQRAEHGHELSSMVLRILPPKLQRATGPMDPPPPDRRVHVPMPVLEIQRPAATSEFTSTTAAVAAAAPASAASSPPPLRLNLPTNMLAAPHVPTAREQALNDPRANGTKLTPEYAIADAAGTLPVTTSTSTDGLESTIIRQGRTRCTRISKPRIATLDPMDSRLRDLPAMSGSCPSK